KTNMADTPIDNSEMSYSLIVGYSDKGERLHITNPLDRIETFETDRYLKQDWIFISCKQQETIYQDYPEILRNSLTHIYFELNRKSEEGRYFGASAYCRWAEDVVAGRFDKLQDLWANYGAYFCTLATNSWANNGIDAPHACFPTILSSLHPEYKEMCDEIAKQYFAIGNNNGKGGIWHDLEMLGGAFNVSNDVMRDKAKRTKISDKLKQAGDCMQEISEVIKPYI
ncbi:MAG: hypothetical protein FWG21_04210, partial [Oscillospiraceae bacterium]|nr:hypothetical protein [Oscillospiraceae bacterium]